ncbi:hypothetical protein ACQ86D_02020 [Streptomyces galilaeus]
MADELALAQRLSAAPAAALHTVGILKESWCQRLRARRTGPYVARARATAARSRFGRHVVTASGRRSPHGHWCAPGAVGTPGT